MSLDVLRNDALQAKRHELESVARSHRAALLGILAVNTVVSENSNLTGLANFDVDNTSLDERTVAFLNKNDVASGRNFDEITLTVPIFSAPPSHHDSSEAVSKAASSTADFAAQDQAAIDADAQPGIASATETAQQHTTHPADVNSSKSPIFEHGKPSADDECLPASVAHANVKHDEPIALPDQLSTPEIVEQAQYTGDIQATLDQREPQRPAKVVHLPPQDVQEQQYRERRADLELRRSEHDADRSQRLAQTQSQVQADLASSPSSTVAYSAATPIPAQDSPDTLPDSDTSHVEILPPKDLQPTPEQQRQKEEHDRILEAQKEIARKQALGDIATPDDQLRWEEREAAAREAEEKAAREDVHGPEPDSQYAFETTEAEQAVEDIEMNDVVEEDATAPEPRIDVRTERKHSTEEHRAQAQKSGLADTTTSQAIEKAIESSPQEVPDTTVANGEPSAAHNTTFDTSDKSKNTFKSASTPRRDAKGVVSPPTSPVTRRRRDNSISSLMSFQTPRQLHSASVNRNTSDIVPLINSLKPLAGAANDPDKDYLEPLFRIQAHDSPNSRTRTLPELIKMGSKVLSTEDQFTTLHERLDYRILRRIYQLQNANRWSLRQMDKCKEPEQPVSHNDHMMAEMRWMRKDFKAERKMKKSVCAWLAHRCSEWVAASHEERMRLQVKVASRPVTQEKNVSNEDALPELEHSGESAPEDDAAPLTPKFESDVPTCLVVPMELAGAVDELYMAGKLSQVLGNLPKTGLCDRSIKTERATYTTVSKFVEGKVLPKIAGPTLKRSRFDYEDEEEQLDLQPQCKRLREDAQSAPEDSDCALFHPDNKHIRDRLHSNNAFRPPSEFLMPSISFYEFRQGSQWIWEDDQKLKKLAKEYSFNWSLIADEMALPTRYKSSAERRTPWECFERWVELESLPADMRKTVYFKTWFQRLEQSQQAAERRYQAQVAAIQQQQAQNGTQAHVPLRRRTIPTRVEKRRSTRYLWMVDGFRKLSKKREQQAWKQGEAARAAAQRKSQTETNQTRPVRLTPQQFSQKRQERDAHVQEMQRQQRQKAMENQQRQIQMARAQQQGLTAAGPGQQRPQGSAAPSQQQPQMQVNSQQGQGTNDHVVQQQGRTGQQQVPTRNGLLTVPQVSTQGMPQAQMQQARAMAQHANIQQIAHANVQQVRNPQFAGQQFQMANGNMPSPGGGLTAQQQIQQNNQAMLAALNVQQQQQQLQLASGPNGMQTQNINQTNTGQQVNASPSMPPPPAPANGTPQQLSSGHVPTIIAIKNQLRTTHPSLTDEQLLNLATQQMKNQSQSNNQVRQSAMNAAAGISAAPHANMQAFAQNRSNYPTNGQMPHNMGNYVNGEGATPQANMTGSSASPSQAYAQKMWQRQMQQMHMQSPNQGHANLNGSPSIAHASPNMTPASPSMNYANLNQMNQMNASMANVNGQRPPSRSATPQMQRLGSSGSVPGVSGMNSGMQSPGTLQGSPRNMQASMAR